MKNLLIGTMMALLLAAGVLPADAAIVGVSGAGKKARKAAEQSRAKTAKRKPARKTPAKKKASQRLSETSASKNRVKPEPVVLIASSSYSQLLHLGQLKCFFIVFCFIVFSLSVFTCQINY